MWGSGAPRLPAIDEKGRLLWRETYSCRRTLPETAWLLILVLLFVVFFILTRDALPAATLEPNLDSRGALCVWLLLSFAFACATAFTLARLLRVIRETVLTRR